MKFIVLALAALCTGASAQCPFSKAKPTAKELHRSRNTQQTERVGGKSSSEITDKINAALATMNIPMKQCSDFSLEDLNSIMRSMHCHMNEHISGNYVEGDGRRLRYSSLNGYETSWSEEMEKAEKDPSTEEVLRAAKCAESLMMFVHHIPQTAWELVLNATSHQAMPILPPVNDDHASHSDEEVAEAYRSSYTCQTGHAMGEGSDDASDHVLPHWPKTVHYTGTAHGAYPFWLGGEGTDSSAEIEVWWSESQSAEKFYHAACHMDEAGYSASRRKTLNRPPPPISDDDDDGSTVPCYHLMLGPLSSAQSYLYTASEDFCCVSTGMSEPLAPPASDFMDDMTLEGEVTIETEYYSGSAYHYTMTLPSSQPVTYFWYTTTLDGYPLQQGEGGTDADTPEGTGLFIYHDYNYTRWSLDSDMDMDDSIFSIPDICQTTQNTCATP